MQTTGNKVESNNVYEYSDLGSVHPDRSLIEGDFNFLLDREI